MRNQKNKKDEWAIKATGGLSYTSKMPCPSWGIPATECHTGGKLFKVPGSVCHDCYARKFRYRWRSVADSLKKRFNAWRAHGGDLVANEWCGGMAHLIGLRPWFRWFETGDIYNTFMMDDIIEVVRRTPTTIHWLPTKEYHLIGDLVRERGPLPPNLTVRLSAYTVDGPLPLKAAERLGCCVAAVSKVKWDCPAHKQGNRCLDCRRCWDKDVPVVTYKFH